MNLNQMKKLGVLGAAACALVFAPLSASAQVDKCSKDVTKNAAKATTDVQKEIAKCVDGWLKTVEKGSGHVKQAEKCQGSFDKIGMGADISSDPKSKLGKAFDKVKGAFPGGAKAKCTDEDLNRLGLLNTATFSSGDVGARLTIMAAFARAWSTQQAVNGLTSRALGGAADSRCSLDETQACNPTLATDPCIATGAGACTATACPECADFSAPLSGGNDSTVASGPCWSSQCRGPGANISETYLGGMAPAVTTVLALHGANPGMYCDVPEILADGIGMVGGPARGQRANLEFPPGSPVIGVCLDGTRGSGYIAKTAANPDLPNVDTVSCGDKDIGNVDDCAGSQFCTVNGRGTSFEDSNQQSCTSASTSAGVAGSSVSLGQIRIHASLATYNDSPFTDPCTQGPFLSAVGAPGANFITTGTASGDLFNSGPGTFSTGVTLSVAAFSGTPFDVAAAEGGTMIGGYAGTSVIIANNPASASIIGDTMTKIDTSCVAP